MPSLKSNSPHQSMQKRCIGSVSSHWKFLSGNLNDGLEWKPALKFQGYMILGKGESKRASHKDSLLSIQKMKRKNQEMNQTITSELERKVYDEMHEFSDFVNQLPEPSRKEIERDLTKIAMIEQELKKGDSEQNQHSFTKSHTPDIHHIVDSALGGASRKYEKKLQYCENRQDSASTTTNSPLRRMRSKTVNFGEFQRNRIHSAENGDLLTGEVTKRKRSHSRIPELLEIQKAMDSTGVRVVDEINSEDDDESTLEDDLFDTIPSYRTIHPDSEIRETDDFPPELKVPNYAEDIFAKRYKKKLLNSEHKEQHRKYSSRLEKQHGAWYIPLNEWSKCSPRRKKKTSDPFGISLGMNDEEKLEYEISMMMNSSGSAKDRKSSREDEETIKREVEKLREKMKSNFKVMQHKTSTKMFTQFLERNDMAVPLWLKPNMKDTSEGEGN